MMEDVEGSTGLREWSLLQQVIASCSEAVLSKHYKHWTNLLTQALKASIVVFLPTFCTKFSDFNFQEKFFQWDYAT